MSNINSLIKCRPEKGKKAVKRSIAAVILAFAITGCIALAAVSDLVSNFLSLVVMVIARIILQFCDLIMNPLLEITQMTTEEIAHYIPGFAMSGDGIGGYFSQAITVISTTIAGALIAVRIISYLMETADGARTESVPKLIWNAVFGMVLTITGSHFLQLMFDEIISPLTTALSEGVTGGGLGKFSFENSGMNIIDLTESGDAAGTIVAWMGGFSIVEGASLVVSVVFLFLIWWNLIKLVLECAERYIICVFTILLSPLAFATATNERTKNTAVNWMQMFWSQCVLLILNIWVVGIARTALNIGLVGASVESVVKWGLVTYAYLKIAQKLDDMLAKAGFRITSTTGLDPMSEAAGAFRLLAGGAHDALNLAGSVAGHGRAAADAIGNVVGGAGSNSKPIDTNPAAAAGANGAATGAASNLDKYGKVSFGDKEKADRFVRSTNAERSDMYNNPGETFNSNSNRQAMANALDELGFDGGKVSQGTVEDLAPDNAIKGAVNGKVTYRDENGKITGVSGFRYSSDESGTTATKTSDLAISPDGQSAILTTDKGKFRLENTGRTAANGSQEWTATRMTDGKGRNLRDTYPDMDMMDTKSFSVPAGQLNKYGADGAAAIAARSAIEGNTLDYLTANTDYAIKRNDEFNAESAAWSAKWAEAEKNYAGRFQMSNEQRFAEMRNPDSAVDYNSPESLVAMDKVLADSDPALADQIYNNGAKVTGIEMAMGRDDMPDGALIVTFGDGDITNTYLVSNPQSGLTDEEAARVIASGQLPKGTAEDAGASENVTGDAGTATTVDGDATAKETDATAPDENGQIAYNSLADGDSEQEVTGAEVGDTVGMTPEAFEATHTPVAAMDEPEPEATSFWGRVASVFSGRHGNNESSEPGVVNPDTVAQGGTTDAAPTGSGVPTPQKATATTTATGATGSANAANTANGTTINANSSAGATAAGGTASRPVGANNVNVVNPDAVANGSGSTRAASKLAGAPTANGTADSKPINATNANAAVTGESAPGSASGTSTNVPQAKSGNGTPTNATVEGSATPLVHEGNAPISGGGTAAEKSTGPVIASTPEAAPAGKNGAAPEQGISTVPAGGNGVAPAGTTGTAAMKEAVPSNAGTLPTEPPANADSTSGGGAAPVVQHTGSEPMVNESDDSDTSSGYVGDTENVGSADMDASPMDGDSATVETHAPASRTGGTADADDEVAVDAGSDYAEPPADAGGASNDVAAPSVQHADNDGISGEGDTGFTGDNDGGGNYSSDEETAPSTQIAKASVAEDDSYIGEPPAKGESSSNVGAIAGHAAPSADGDGDDFDDNDVGSASFGGSNGSSHDENPGSDASSGSGEETSNDDATAPTVQHQNVGNNSHDDGSSSDDNGGTTVSAPSTPAPEIQGGGAVSSESAGSDNDGSAGQTAPAASVTENTAPAKATPKTTAEASRTEDNPAPAAQNFNQGGVGEDTGDSGDADGSAARKQPAEKPPVDGTQFYADTSRSNSFTEAGTSGASNGPEIRPLSHLSIKAFNDTNGFVESDGIGRIQVTRVSVDRDTGITQWRIMQKLDADGNVPEVPDVMNIERSAKYNKRTRQYEPETFESIARQLGKVDDYESVGPDTDESYKRRRQNNSQDRASGSKPQQKNAYEGKSFRERNTRNERNERNNRFQQMMQGNKSHNGSKSKKDKPFK